MAKNGKKIAVVIPCFKVSATILNVISELPKIVDYVVVVDDACPEKTGQVVAKAKFTLPVKVITHSKNMGVGGAMISGYLHSLKLGADIIVKMDGDGQMDPKHISRLIEPLLNTIADYTKGNRFYNVNSNTQMPKVRFFGNIFLSFLTKISSGYWKIFDPNNGYTAISRTALANIPLGKISNSYFFESDMLFRLGLIKAVVLDIPMDAKYQDSNSSLKISRVLIEFPLKHIRNIFKRIAYNYYLRDFTIASIELIFGLLLTSFGIIYGGMHFIFSLINQTPTPVSALFLTSLTILVGFQLFLSFINADLLTSPTEPISYD
jgi:hypothetical protein